MSGCNKGDCPRDEERPWRETGMRRGHSGHQGKEGNRYSVAWSPKFLKRRYTKWVKKIWQFLDHIKKNKIKEQGWSSYFVIGASTFSLVTGRIPVDDGHGLPLHPDVERDVALWHVRRPLLREGRQRLPLWNVLQVEEDRWIERNSEWTELIKIIYHGPWFRGKLRRKIDVAAVIIKAWSNHVATSPLVGNFLTKQLRYRRGLG